MFNSSVGPPCLIGEPCNYSDQDPMDLILNRTKFDTGCNESCIVLISIAYGLITVLGLFGNISVLSQVKLSSNQKVQIWFLIRLAALADLIHILVCLPDIVSSIKLHGYILKYAIPCKVTRYAQGFTMHASLILQLVAIIERYLRICHPWVSVRMNINLHVRRSAAGAWAIAMIYTLPHSVFSEIVRGMCKQRSFPGETIYKIVEFVLFYATPAFLFVVLYCRIYCSLYRSKDDAGASATFTSQKKFKENRGSMVKSLLACIAAHLICNSPIQYIFLHSIISQGNHYRPNYVTAMIFVGMKFLSAAISPVIYFFFMKKFRLMLGKPLMKVKIRISKKFGLQHHSTGVSMCQTDMDHRPLRAVPSFDISEAKGTEVQLSSNRERPVTAVSRISPESDGKSPLTLHARNHCMLSPVSRI